MRWATLTSFCLLTIALAEGADDLIPKMLPYGDRERDYSMKVYDQNDDKCPKSYHFPIAMYGRSYSEVYVCTNGALSLDESFSEFTPERFPISTPLICPFWADADLRRGGNVYSRITTNPVLLMSISAYISDNVGSKGLTFDAKRLLIVTWENVKAYGRNSDNSENTFQAVVATDGVTTFVRYYYEKINWVFGSASGKVPALVGYNAGNGKDYYMYDDSLTNSIINIASKTNTGKTGEFIFSLSSRTLCVNMAYDKECMNAPLTNLEYVTRPLAIGFQRAEHGSIHHALVRGTSSVARCGELVIEKGEKSREPYGHTWVLTWDGIKNTAKFTTRATINGNPNNKTPAQLAVVMGKAYVRAADNCQHAARRAWQLYGGDYNDSRFGKLYQGDASIKEKLGLATEFVGKRKRREILNKNVTIEFPHSVCQA